MKKNHKILMLEALRLAEKASLEGEVPVGCIVVLENNIIGRGYNNPIKNSSPSAHAEIIALNSAAKKIANYRLVGADLYTTLEPCLMCYGALVHARINRCFFAASDPKSGVVTNDIITKASSVTNHKVEFIQGEYSQESKELLQNFFKDRRKK
jgi:tRNA(adenine34) deaminase